MSTHEDDRLVKHIDEFIDRLDRFGAGGAVEAALFSGHEMLRRAVDP